MWRMSDEKPDAARQAVIATVEAYLNGLRTKDLKDVPLHPDIEYAGLFGTWVKGANIFRGVLTSMFPIIKDVTVVRHIVDGDWCATAFNLETTTGTLPVLDCFHVVDGQIVSIRVYYDPGMRGATAWRNAS